MNSLASLFGADGEVFGTWSQIASEDLIDMLGAAGYAFTIVDCEHTAISVETAERLFRACKANRVAPLVRVPSNDRVWIARCLDAGALGIVVPGIESAASAQAAVAASRFGPEGSRGACPCVRAGDHFVRDWPAYAKAQESGTGVILLVETRAGLDVIEEICAVPGVRGLLVGPFDLSVSLGHRGDYQHPEVQAGVLRMLDAARACGVPVMMPVFSPHLVEAGAQVETWRARGVRHFVLGTDKILIGDQFGRYLAALKPAGAATAV